MYSVLARGEREYARAGEMYSSFCSLRHVRAESKKCNLRVSLIENGERVSQIEGCVEEEWDNLKMKKLRV